MTKKYTPSEKEKYMSEKQKTYFKKKLVEWKNEIIELYVPIYEARLIGPKKNVRLMRIDSIRKKVL